MVPRLRLNSLSEKRQVLYASMWIWSSHFRARQVVVIDLLHASALGNYHSIIALMVLQVEMVGGVSGVAEGVISVVGQSHR